MISLTWYGTFSFKLSDGKDEILFDPFIRYEKRKDTSFKNNYINNKNVLITHGHIDHTVDLIDLYKGRDVKIYTTITPSKRLLADGLNKKQIIKIKYDDSYRIGNILIKVLKGKHIKFDLKIIMSTLFNKNLIKYFNNLSFVIKNNFKCRENGETVIYQIECGKKKFLFMGSMEIDKKTIYPKNVDYLVLAYQGRSDLEKRIIKIINEIKPNNIILGHFDNSFPPVSRQVDISNLDNLIDKNIKIIIPSYDEKIIL